MRAQEAVKAAKSYVGEMFAEEGIMNLGLEEIEFDDVMDTWLVTLGFSRPWNQPANHLAVLLNGQSPPGRSYKSVRIKDETGAVLSVRNREVAA